MKVYRIERKKYLPNCLSGIGASLVDGFRWNSRSTKLVYTAESRALATLEVSVHLDLSEDLPKDRYFIEIDIPKDVLILDLKVRDLPKYWDAKPPNKITQLIGDDFVNENNAAVLKVPSSIIQQEFNYLINPLHPDMKKIKLVNKTPMRFDKRLTF